VTIQKHDRPPEGKPSILTRAPEVPDLVDRDSFSKGSTVREQLQGLLGPQGHFAISLAVLLASRRFAASTWCLS
jgi:hypothetical protein